MGRLTAAAVAAYANSSSDDDYDDEEPCRKQVIHLEPEYGSGTFVWGGKWYEDEVGFHIIDVEGNHSVMPWDPGYGINIGGISDSMPESNESAEDVLEYLRNLFK